jgi:Aromatic-ring-opening dioxygenase LigAB, LigA subunit
MSRLHLERALYHLGHNAPLVQDHDTPEEALDALIAQTRGTFDRDPTAPHRPYELTAQERDAIVDGDVAQIYRWGVHPNLIRNFAGVWGIDYTERYRAAGL